MGDMPVEVTGGNSTEIDSADGMTDGFVFHAKDPRSALMIMTASGTMLKPDTLCEPLP
jgi:hypothetical protein